MEGKTLARIGAVVFVAIAITATAIEMARKDKAPETAIAAHSATSPGDPLRSALVRCQRLGEAGTRDAGCLQAWSENRRRFLGSGPLHDDIPAATLAMPDAPASKETVPASAPDTAEAR